MNEDMEAFDKKCYMGFGRVPIGIKPIGRKQVFKEKLIAKGKVEKYKVHLVSM